MRARLGILLIVLSVFGGQMAMADVMEINCTIRSSSASLNCQVMGKERKVMSPEEVTNFVDAGKVAAYITLKGRRGLERTYMIDRNAPQYRKLSDIEKSGSMSEIAKAKSDLFNDIEKKVIKISDDLDAQAASAELVISDSSVTFDKLKRTNRDMVTELEGYRKNKEKLCTNTPAFENMSKANSRLQQTLSNILYAFQTPDSCMSEYKVFKDRDGAVDLRQLDSVTDHFKANCRKK